MNNYIVGIPTLNRADLLIPAVAEYSKNFETVVIIDNGNQGLKLDYPNVYVYVPGFNLGVAESWNFLAFISFYMAKKDYLLLINDDVSLGYGAEVVNAAITNCTGLAQSEYSFSVVLLSKQLYEKVGVFDTSFYPAYYEDSDYLYRMKLLGIRQDVIPALNPKVFRQSQTYEKNNKLVNDAMARNREIYIQKWGGLPLLETFKKPYHANT